MLFPNPLAGLVPAFLFLETVNVKAARRSGKLSSFLCMSGRGMLTYLG